MAVTSGKSETYTVIDFYNKAEKEYFLSIARYKWEFLRRNKNYIEDFNKKCTPIKKFKDILGSPLTEEHRNYLFSKYGFITPFNPKLSFYDFLKIRDRKGKVPSYLLGLLTSLIIYDWTVPGFATSGMPVKCHYITNTNITLETKSNGKPYFCDLPGNKVNFNPQKTDFHDITIRVNLNAPKELIHTRIREIVNLWKGLYDKYYRPRRRNRTEYDRYLTVYDLREQGWQWGKLADKFYKGDTERGDIDYAKKKVRRDYERCKKMIDGGYRQIR